MIQYAPARFIMLLALVALLSCQDDRRPPEINVVITVIDTLRADHLGHYGYGRNTSIALDRFRSQATIFTECYAPAPWTVPSTATLLTGQFTSRHRVTQILDKLDPSAITLAEILRDGGWNTAAFSFNSFVAPSRGLDQGFMSFNKVPDGRDKYYPDISEMFTEIRSWLDGGAHKPFFIYLQPMNVHGPYQVPEHRRSALLGRSPGREFSYRGAVWNHVMWGQLEWRDKVTEAYLRSFVDQYDTAIRYSLDELGAFFDHLVEKGLYEDSLIIVTADHGEELYDHEGFEHSYTLHREVLQVPLYIKMPRQQKGKTVSERTSLMDIFPTVTEVTGMDAGLRVDGRSLVPLIRGHAATESFSERSLLFHTEWQHRGTARAILSDRYKLIEIEKNYEKLEDVHELYDVVADPLETTDLSTEMPDVVQRLRQEMRDGFAAYGYPPAAAARHTLTEEERDKLRALGYIDDHPSGLENADARGE